ncbi:hypothetical protein Cgig2_008628 [Carnegiea gigantea]|uniref:Protein kinase domain-containing protein n=1 Tax=Carnegiea gigantea TaxID=171969 RepID=A0A9Q1JVQ3_9CARY|nr:hypothetical protein Cgig2_008628 [Carnegiea gigantea]
MANNFHKIIGQGGSATVYHGFLKDGTEVAVKILNGSSTASVQMLAELSMRVCHRNLVSLVGYCDDGRTVALTYEYMTRGFGGCKPAIVHRDLKPANILLDHKLMISIEHISTDHVAGTPGYLDPEANHRSKGNYHGEDLVYVVKGAMPLLERGDKTSIINVVDSRLQRDFSTDSA